LTDGRRRDERRRLSFAMLVPVVVRNPRLYTSKFRVSLLLGKAAQASNP